MRKLCTVLTIAGAILILSPNALLAQHADRGGKGSSTWVLVKQPMNLPDLPKYSGKAVFDGGLMYPNKPGGSAISLRFRAKDDPDTVLQWYKDALKNNQWQVKPTKNQSSVRAIRGHNGVVISVTQCNSPGYRSNLKISYKLAK